MAMSAAGPSFEEFYAGLHANTYSSRSDDTPIHRSDTALEVTCSGVRE